MHRRMRSPRTPPYTAATEQEVAIWQPITRGGRLRQRSRSGGFGIGTVAVKSELGRKLLRAILYGAVVLDSQRQQSTE